MDNKKRIPGQKSKAQMLRDFMMTNPDMSQGEVREYFKRRGIHVSPPQTSIAAKEAGLRKGHGKPGRPKRDSPAGKVIRIPVAEAPVMAKRIQNLRKKNERLRRVIDLLLEEEVDALKE